MKVERKLVTLLSIADCIGISSRRKAQIRKMLLLAAICFFAGNVAGQTVYEESQARLIEPEQSVFIVPLIADIQLVDKGGVRQDFGPYEFDINSLSTTTFMDIDQYKANALYRAAREADADLIVAATFNVKSDAKGKKMIINVSGYPGKYINFRSLKFDKPEDYKWIESVYFTSSVFTSEKQKSEEKEKAATK
ncbi:MAG: hypothetical protein FWD60_07265 [Candidatus Azobacteroides sp.]|nr:hypothetical protein [Candidatus Azobacteroides sp.]